jgi:SAM-dependent MidA family methyltransferase
VPRAEQAKRCTTRDWHRTLDDLPCDTRCVVANEFFDAWPIGMWVAATERRVKIRQRRLELHAPGHIRPRFAREESQPPRR